MNNKSISELIARIQDEARLLKEDAKSLETSKNFTKEDLILILDFITELLPLISKYFKK